MLRAIFRKRAATAADGSGARIAGSGARGSAGLSRHYSAFMRNLLTGLVLSALLLGGGAGASGWTFFPDASRPTEAYWAKEVKPAEGEMTLPTTAAAFASPAAVSRVFLTGAIIQDYRSGTQVTCFSMANGGQLSGSLVVLMSRFTYVMTTAVQKAGLGTIDPLGDRSVFAAVDCTPELLEEHVQPEALTLYVLPGRLTALPFPLDGLNLNLSADAAGQFVPVLSRR